MAAKKTQKILPQGIGQSNTEDNHALWYENNIKKYADLAETVATALKNSLNGAGISYVDVPYRHKEKSSFLKKLTNRNYKPADMTDLAGIRIITLVESDVERVSQLIEKMFNIHEQDSINKSASLGHDKVGYRSVHFVCDIGESRSTLHEFIAFKDLCFEIQVRTALEHAWAEIEHDRGYKLGGELPSHLKRRFALLSGLLESADLEFNRLTVEIAEYAKTLEEKFKENDLEFELSTVSITTFLENKYPELDIDNLNGDNNNLNRELLEELENFGIKNLKQLDKLIKNSLFSLKKAAEITNALGFLRNCMMIEDLERYFGDEWKKNPHWDGLSEKVLDILYKKYDKKFVDSILKENKIRISNY